MEKEFIINNVNIVLELSLISYGKTLIDVTSIQDSWRNYIASGLRFVEIEGIDKDGKKINGKFQIIEEIKGILVLKSIVD